MQLPPQHWLLAEQMSPFCAQKEEPAQTPVLQTPEQQSAPVVQLLPVVRQVPPGFTGAHLRLVQMPLQHWVPDVQSAATGLSGKHACPAHFLSTPQKPLQQSAATPQVTPTDLQAPPSGVLHTLGVGMPHDPPLVQGPEPTPH